MIAEGICGLRILVVEDEALIAEELRERLTRVGATVVGTVDTAAAAVETAIRTRPDIVLMDIRLRGKLDGIAAANDIRDAIDAPVVFLTSHSDRATLERAKGSARFGYVLKPFNERELLITLEMANHHHTLERQLARTQEQLAAAQKMESIGRLASGIAHDFNNLLTVVNGSAEMALEDQSLSNTTRLLLTDIVQAGLRAATLTRQFLAFGRKESLKPQALDLNTLITNLVAMLRRLIREDIELSLELAPVPVVAFADPTQVEQIIVNLVVNARDALPNGGCIITGTRIVEVSEANACEVGAEPGCYAVLTVNDTGTGIDEVIREHIFEPYFTTKGVGEGSGLGLATVYGIAKQSGGSVTVRSALGQGASFAVYLPAMPTTSMTTAATVESGSARGRETILLVEDESAVRSLVAVMLRRKGYEILEAANGPQALDVYARHAGQVHIVVTDVVMPDMPGPQLISRLRDQTPALRAVYMSEYTNDQMSTIGDDAFIAKPFTPGVLAQKVREVLDR